MSPDAALTARWDTYRDRMLTPERATNSLVCWITPSKVWQSSHSRAGCMGIC